MTTARLTTVGPARLRDARRRARRSRRRRYAERAGRAAGAGRRRRLRPPRRLRRPRAQRQPRVPDRASTRGSRRRCWSSGRPATRAILVGNECYGMAGAAPLRDAPRAVPGLQPARASRATGRGRSPRSWRGRGSARARGSASLGWKTYADDARIEVPAFIVDELRALVGPGGSVENANGLLIDPADGLRVINDVDQLAVFEHASCQTSDGVAAAAGRRLRAGDDRGRGGPAPALERDAAVVPPDADGRAARRARAAEPGRPADRARRPVHHRVRHLGRADLPRRLASSRTPTSCRTAIGDYVDRLVGPVLRRGRGVVRGAARRPGRRRAPGDHRPPPRRPVLRHLAQPGPPAPPRRVGQLAGLARLDGRAAVGHGDAGRHHPGHRHALLHDQHRGRDRARRRRAAGGVRRRVPGGVGADPGPPRVHARRAGHRPPPRRAAALEPRRCLPPFLLRPTGR